MAAVPTLPTASPSNQPAKSQTPNSITAKDAVCVNEKRMKNARKALTSESYLKVPDTLSLRTRLLEFGEQVVQVLWETCQFFFSHGELTKGIAVG